MGLFSFIGNVAHDIGNAVIQPVVSVKNAVFDTNTQLKYNTGAFQTISKVENAVVATPVKVANSVGNLLTGGAVKGAESIVKNTFNSVVAPSKVVKPVQSATTLKNSTPSSSTAGGSSWMLWAGGAILLGGMFYPILTKKGK